MSRSDPLASQVPTDAPAEPSAGHTEPHSEAQAQAVRTVAADLSAIEELHERLRVQAWHLASDPELPGGDAMVMLCAVASPEAWANQLDAYERAGVWPDLAHEDDREPPLQLLLYWSERWRYERGATTDLRPTVGTEAGFIRQCLDWAWQHEPHWHSFATDVGKARGRLEGLLRAGTRPERTAVPCIDIDCQRRPVLVKIYGKRAVDDRYRCPSCRRSYDAAEFARAQHERLASEGAARWVPLADAVAALDRPEKTLRRWVAEGRAASCCERSSHRLLVWWPDMRALHVDPPARGRPRRLAS